MLLITTKKIASSKTTRTLV